MHLFAAEPDVVDPVALAFDAAERMYVVEMRDYPQGMAPDGAPGGTVRLLEDLDRDGRADRSTVFAEDLSFPTSIAPWRDGVFVTAPPQILWLADTDGDRRADERQVVFDGFTLGVTDSNVNGLRWALDNRIHGSNGGNGGEVRPAEPPADGGTGGADGGDGGRAMVALRGLDFRFDPRTRALETTYHTSGGFGLAFDAWGRSVSTYNVDHLQQRIVATRYLARAPALPPLDATENVSVHGAMARIFPISRPATRPNHPEQAGHYSSAGGLGYLDFPSDDLPRGVLICDVVGNLVSREIPRLEGPVFVTERAEEEREREFFASRDPSFRPVGVEMGPDGALYLVDMQRDVIEHPDYIPRALRETIDLRAGSDRGRIYRIVPRSGLPAREPVLEGAAPDAWLAALSSASRWRRDTAQRLLVERGAAGAEEVAALRAMAIGGAAAAPDDGGGSTEPQRSSTASPSSLAAPGALPSAPARTPPATAERSALGRVHALWTLAGLARVDQELIRAVLRDPHPGVRENALQVAETMLPGSRSLAGDILDMAGDPSPRVRFQAALTIGELAHPDRTAALLRILRRDATHRFTRVAVASALGDGARDALGAVLRWTSAEPSRSSRMSGGTRHRAATSDALLDPATAELVVRELADLVGAGLGRADAPALETPLRATRDPAIVPAVREAVLAGIAGGLERASAPPFATPATAQLLDSVMTDGSAAAVRSAWAIRRATGLADGPAQAALLAEAVRTMTDGSAAVEDRIAAIDVVALGSWSAARDPLLSLLASGAATDLQARAIDALAAFDDPALGRLVVDRFGALGPRAREGALRLLLRRPAYHGEIVAALEEGRLAGGELDLDLEQRRRLLRSEAPGVAARAAALLRDEEYGNRAAVVGEWLARLPEQGSAQRGKAVYARLCAQCHVAADEGHAVGPDLASLVHRSVEDLVTSILDPHLAIHPDYVAYEVALDSGESEVGLIAAETAGAITLLQAGGARRTIPRARIGAMRSTGASLMPSGLEQGLEPRDLRDLVAFIQGRD
jgi:putative membrane-bound dehydrogenase-like protein